MAVQPAKNSLWLKQLQIRLGLESGSFCDGYVLLEYNFGIYRTFFYGLHMDSNYFERERQTLQLVIDILNSCFQLATPRARENMQLRSKC